MSKSIQSLVFISLLLASSISCAKPYKGAELYSIDQVLYGKFNIRMRAAKGSGLLSTFFTYKDGSEQSGVYWEEIDIEIFGKDNAEVWQSNIITGDDVRVLTEAEHHSDVSYGDVYHTFSIEWRPSSVTWLVDGEVVRIIENTDQVESLTNLQSYRFNIWPSTIPSWTGPWDDSILPVYMYVNWIEYYSWNGEGFDFEWRDDFDTLDESRWQKATWTFNENRSDFDPDNIVVQDGTLVLGLTAEGDTGFEGSVPEDNDSGNSNSSSSTSSSSSASSSSSSSSTGSVAQPANPQLDFSQFQQSGGSSGGGATNPFVLLGVLLLCLRSISVKAKKK